MLLRSTGLAHLRLGKMRFRYWSGVACGLLGCFLIGTPIIQAAPVFTATVGYAAAGYPTLTNKGPTAVEAALSSSVPSGGGTDTKNEFAAAGPSGVRASARVTLSAAYSGAFAAFGGPADTGTADAKAQFDDLRFRGFNGDRSGSTVASLNLDLSGTFLTNVNAFFDPDPDNPYTASANTFTAVQVSVIVPNVLFGGTPQSQSFSYFQNRDTSGTFIGSLFDSGRITTQPFSFYNGVDNQLIIELFVRVQGACRRIFHELRHVRRCLRGLLAHRDLCHQRAGVQHPRRLFGQLRRGPDYGQHVRPRAGGSGAARDWFPRRAPPRATQIVGEPFFGGIVSKPRCSGRAPSIHWTTG